MVANATYHRVVEQEKDGYKYGLRITPKVVSVDDMRPAAFEGQRSFAPWENSIYDGSKFPGGFGTTQVQHIDIETMRERSNMMFNQNLYGRGLIRRLITNEINTGLFPEASPEERILGVEEDSLVDWTDDVESRFGLWGEAKTICDWRGRLTFGAIQREARREALVAGDVLVVLLRNESTGLPSVQLIEADRIVDPLARDDPKLPKGREIREGVEIDEAGRHVAFWILQKDFSVKRVEAANPRTGITQAWLYYGSDKRYRDTRGQPLLTIVLQSLNEIDRYRDASLRKAVVNSILAMFITKTEDKPGTLPIQGAARRNSAVEVTDSDGSTRNLTFSKTIPGLVLQELQTGETPVAFRDQGTGTNFGEFEKSVVAAIAWANEIPPEILTLSFDKNYSASQAAINEFNLYLQKFRKEHADFFCTPIYIEWLLTETLRGKIDAPGLFEASRDPAKYDIFGAWTAVQWYGTVKVSTDPLKAAKAAGDRLALGATTYGKVARELDGSKFSKNAARQRREIELLLKARMPIIESEKAMSERTGAEIDKNDKNEKGS